MIHSLFITVPYTLLQVEPDLNCTGDTGVNILLNTAAFDINVIVTFARRNKIKYMFSLSARMLDETPDEIFSKIYILFTLSDGCGEAAHSIPLFDARVLLSENQRKLQDFFKQQGEHTIHFVNVEQGTNSVHNSILFCSREHIESLNAQNLKSYLNQDIKKIFVWYDDAMKPIETTDNAFAAMLLTATAFNSVAEQHRHQSLLWQRRASLYLSFINLGKRISQEAYYGIKDWYSTEYEVLPLWYKRFGHIIKVFMGKRSFQSLFDDELKKS